MWNLLGAVNLLLPKDSIPTKQFFLLLVKLLAKIIIIYFSASFIWKCEYLQGEAFKMIKWEFQSTWRRLALLWVNFYWWFLYLPIGIPCRDSRFYKWWPFVQDVCHSFKTPYHIYLLLSLFILLKLKIKMFDFIFNYIFDWNETEKVSHLNFSFFLQKRFNISLFE